MLIFLPKRMGCFNIFLLARLCSASEKKHEILPVFAEINAISRTKIEP